MSTKKLNKDTKLLNGVQILISILLTMRENNGNYLQTNQKLNNCNVMQCLRKSTSVLYSNGSKYHKNSNTMSINFLVAMFLLVFLMFGVYFVCYLTWCLCFVFGDMCSVFMMRISMHVFLFFLI